MEGLTLPSQPSCHKNAFDQAPICTQWFFARIQSMRHPTTPEGFVFLSSTYRKNAFLSAYCRRTESVHNELGPLMTGGGKNLQQLKCSTRAKAWEYRLPVWRDGSVLADLVPVGEWVLDDHELVQTMSRWRQESVSMFLIHFDSTVEKTMNYLREMSIADPARILFIIYRNGVAVGHIGFSGVTDVDAELDNVMRGEPSGLPRFMTSVSAVLIRWGFDVLGVESIHLRATSHNDSAISLYSNLGFEVEESLPLQAHHDGEFVVHRPCAEADADVDFRLQVMRLRRERFGEELPSS